jgi:hypothetical protein
MFASGLVVGGLLIAPGAVILSGIERRPWERAVSPLVETDFPRALADALRARPIEQSGPAHEPLKVEVIVNGWGLHEERGRVCFTVSIDLVVRSMDRELLKDRLLIREGHGSPDAPPAQCASLERMGEQERWQEQVEASGRQLQAEVVDYLVRQKGYEARAVDLPPAQGEEAARARPQSRRRWPGARAALRGAALDDRTGHRERVPHERAARPRPACRQPPDQHHRKPIRRGGLETGAERPGDRTRHASRYPGGAGRSRQRRTPPLALSARVSRGQRVPRAGRMISMIG